MEIRIPRILLLVPVPVIVAAAAVAGFRLRSGAVVHPDVEVAGRAAIRHAGLVGVQVARRGRKAFVAQKPGRRGRVHAPAQGVGGIRVPQRVGRHPP